MWSTIKAIPVFPKIVLGSLLLLLFAALSHRGHSQPTPVDDWSSRDQRSDRPQVQPASAQNGFNQSELASRYLAQFKAQQFQIQTKERDCTIQMQQTSNQWYTHAGQMPGGLPPCEQYMPQLIAQEAYVEGVIYRLQTGDVRCTLAEITGVQVGGSSGGSYYRPSTPQNDGTAAVENYSRESIRGNNLYTDESGNVTERALSPYLYRNRVTGEYLPANQPYVPNDGRDYEQLTPQN